MPKVLCCLTLLAILAVVILLMACGSGKPDSTVMPYPANPPPTTTRGPELPLTTAASMMAYLEDVDYQTSWRRWPGLGEKYPSTGAHTVLLTTYLNPPARAAVVGKEGAMPPNSIIVKESYTEAGEFRNITVMYKVAGYHPEHNDWFWLKVLDDGTVDQEGKPEGCFVCHSEMKSNDYIFIGGPTSLSK